MKWVLPPSPCGLRRDKDAHAGMPSIALGATEGDLGVTAAK